jgi:hypothetical protein
VIWQAILSTDTLDQKFWFAPGLPASTLKCDFKVPARSHPNIANLASEFFYQLGKHGGRLNQEK